MLDSQGRGKGPLVHALGWQGTYGGVEQVWHSMCHALAREGPERPDRMVRRGEWARVTCTPCLKQIEGRLRQERRPWAEDPTHVAARERARVRAWAAKMIVARHQAEFDDLVEGELAMALILPGSWSPPEDAVAS